MLVQLYLYCRRGECYSMCSSVFSGLGYIVGANVAALFHQWQYALRVG